MVVLIAYFVGAVLAWPIAARWMYRDLDSKYPNLGMNESDEVTCVAFGAVCAVVWPVALLMLLGRHPAIYLARRLRRLLLGSAAR